jgi:hypothetical protein
MEKTSRVKKIVTKMKIKEAKSDYAYWAGQPFVARLAALEEIRREYHQWKFGAEPRLQRVYTIVKR